MTNEWTKLTGMLEVAEAQAEGWEIEVHTINGWELWRKTSWQRDLEYRARPTQPKMKKMKMLCWVTSGCDLLWRKEGWGVDKAVRVPAQDIEIEISEGV